jgi:hypothetical protein
MIMCTAKVTRAVPARKQAPPAIMVALRPHLHSSHTNTYSFNATSAGEFTYRQTLTSVLIKERPSAWPQILSCLSLLLTPKECNCSYFQGCCCISLDLPYSAPLGTVPSV